jgi:hypothetical protein
MTFSSSLLPRLYQLYSRLLVLDGKPQLISWCLT